MSKRIARVEPAVTVIVGVDTHKHVHVAVAVDRLGARLGSCSVPANRGGYTELVAWARPRGAVEAFGIEGTGSYGVGLASFGRRHAVNQWVGYGNRTVDEMGHAWVNVTYLDDEDFQATVVERERLLDNASSDGGQ